MRLLVTFAVVCGTALLGIETLAADERVAPDLRDAYRRPPDIPFPSSNPYSLEKAALGKALFFEPRLSGAENLSCASCHNPSFGWEARDTAVPAAKPGAPRRAPTILDTAWVHPFYWDGRAATAEKQAKGPIQGSMNLPLAQAVSRLAAIPEYKARFDRVFPKDGVTADTITAAIATYERTVVSSYAPFDAWVDGDETAISASAKRGFVIFQSKARCAGCHSGWHFTDNRFHDIGTTETDIGRAAVEPDNPLAKYAFKTPSLRNLTQRSPYMHTGAYPTLEAVVVHYIGGGIDRPSRSPLMGPVALTSDEVDDLVAFMRTLTGSKQTVALPILPN